MCVPYTLEDHKAAYIIDGKIRKLTKNELKEINKKSHTTTNRDQTNQNKLDAHRDKYNQKYLK
jgi:protein required for attachment to host cells